MDQDELIEHWTLLAGDVELLASKRGAARLGFALLLMYFTRHARFPRGRSEFGAEVVDFVARQVGVEASELGFYDWSGRTIKAHRTQIREHFSFRECTVADAEMLTGWLVDNVTQLERGLDQVRAELLARARDQRIEPPSDGRVERVVRSALDRGEKDLVARICVNLPEQARTRLDELVFGVPDEPCVEMTGGQDSDRDVLAWVKTDPGRLSLNTMLAEVGKLEAIRAVGLPADLLVTVAPKIVSGWRVRAAVQSPSHFRGFAHRPGGCCLRRCWWSGNGRSPTRWWSC